MAVLSHGEKNGKAFGMRCNTVAKDVGPIDQKSKLRSKKLYIKINLLNDSKVEDFEAYFP